MSELSSYYENVSHFERDTMRMLIRRSPNRVAGTWTTREGETILISEMKNSHLRNTIEMLRRSATKHLLKKLNHVETDISEPDGASVYDDFDATSLSSMDEDERALAAWGEVYNDLIAEALFRSEEGDLKAWLAL